MPLFDIIKILPLLILFSGFIPYEAFSQDARKQELRVLFIGNSLTYTNDLPAVVAAIAKAGKQKKLVYKTIAEPNYALEDHWNNGNTLKVISKGKWDFVVMQQGPSGSADGRRDLLKQSKRFAEEIIKTGAKPALFMVWPPEEGKIALSDVIRSYQDAAIEADALILPAGKAWLASRESDPSIKLYSDDGFHPSLNGTYLSALVIYQTLFDASIDELPAIIDLPSSIASKISSDHAAKLRSSAGKAMDNK